MVQARSLGMMHIIPERWRAQAIDDYLDTQVTVVAAAPASESFTNYSSDKRANFAAKGWALPSGAYAIANEADLRHAVRAFNECPDNDKTRVRRHIVKRARTLGKVDVIPPSWRTVSASLETRLAKRVATFNASHDRTLSTALLRTVYLRGMSAHARVAATSTLLPQQFGMARVNSFLRLAAGDPSASPLDADLLAGA